MNTWHQSNAIKTNNSNRHLKAHIVDQKRYGLYGICGQHLPRVTVGGNYRSEKNNTCKKCLKKLGNPS